jgi:NTP pyrophosphatase (non-canonical NTP hydrolase)
MKNNATTQYPKTTVTLTRQNFVPEILRLITATSLWHKNIPQGNIMDGLWYNISGLITEIQEVKEALPSPNRNSLDPEIILKYLLDEVGDCIWYVVNTNIALNMQMGGHLSPLQQVSDGHLENWIGRATHSYFGERNLLDAIDKQVDEHNNRFATLNSVHSAIRNLEDAAIELLETHNKFFLKSANLDTFPIEQFKKLHSATDNTMGTLTYLLAVLTSVLTRVLSKDDLEFLGNFPSDVPIYILPFALNVVKLHRRVLDTELEINFQFSKPTVKPTSKSKP